MIDYVNCSIPYAFINISKLKSKIDFVGLYVCKTNEVKDYCNGELYGVKFTTSNEKLSVKGSLHKFHNKGLHNANDFTYEMLLEVLECFKKELGIDVSKANIHSLETGVNLFGYPIQDNQLFGRLGFHYPAGGKFDLFYCKQPDVDLYCLRDKKRQVRLKLYYKSKEIKSLGIESEEEILRAEIHIGKSRVLNKIGVYTLDDLRDFKKLTSLTGLLVKQFQDVCFVQTLNEVKAENCEVILQAQPDYWRDLKKEVCNTTFRNYLKVYKMGRGKKADAIKDDLIKRIEEQFKYLLSTR